MSYQDDQIANNLGLMFQPGLATGFPDLVPKVQAIYSDRIAKLPWVPPTWLASAQALQQKYPGDLLRPAPGYNALHVRGQMAPIFADTTDKLDVWDRIYNDTNSAIVAYAKQFQEDGAQTLNDLYADAAFWDAALKLATFVKNLPGAIVQGAAGGASDVFAQFLPAALRTYAKWILLAIALLVVGGVLVFYKGRLGAIAKGLKLKMPGKA